MNETRQEAYERLMAMAGLDPNGGICPPPPGFTVNHEPISWWRNRVTEVEDRRV